MPPDQPHTTTPQEVRLTDETIEYLDKLITKAVNRGLSEAVNEENAKKFWTAGLNVLQDQAVKHTGRFVLGGIWGLSRKLMGFIALGLIVYQFGGWTALAKLWSALWSST